MDFDTGRRRFLQLAGTGTALSLAGCSALDGDAAAQDDTETTTDGGRTTALAVRTDREQLRKRQQEIQSALSSGNISRSEAQKRYQTAQRELRSEAVASFRERAASNSDLSVVDAVEQFGVLLVSGSATALIDALSFSSVDALLPEETFRQARQQAQRQSPGGASTTTPD